ncbi:MipA/OmpV family protein [Undibacterium sp. Jales W-56]|uniref:MipA/OmpV family protein n=1 Tax=Undibacterium sp. Jales W-56 TaxID=2897325 RepID=UPI0021D151D0|nr:MipA/OmpV family protein [Undibacterium sp. Jales W-56]MCU6432886.1 MipA/OmpV family protein [Undibacterium sp. Jales W-56]
MKKFLLIALTALSGNSFAQSLAANLMPDGSRDVFVGLAIAAAPHYEGRQERKVSLMPIMQMQWSNGIFIADPYTAGMHLSNRPDIEFGPLLQYQPSRSASAAEKAAGASDIGAALNAGGFFNYYLNDKLRLNSSLLYANGGELSAKLGLQKIFGQIAPHHTLAVSGGIVWANRDYAEKYFGILPSLAVSDSGNPGLLPVDKNRNGYRPSAGIKDLHLGANWNWELNHRLLLSSGVSAVHLTNSAAHSPLVEQRNYLTIHSGLAYRF